MKKSNLFEKAKTTKSGVIEGGINELIKSVKQNDDGFDWKSPDAVRVSCYITRDMRNRYKAILNIKGTSVDQDLRDHVIRTIEESDKNIK